MLSRAFLDDPLLSFLIPDRTKRSAATPRFMRSLLADACRFDEIWVAQEDRHVVGAAAWLPPGAYPLGARRAAMSVLRDLPSARHLGRRIAVGVRLYAAIDGAHSQLTDGHWYLASLGCEPTRQRQGLGSVLVQAVLARADDAGVTAYLETSNPDNVPWYGRHGFEVVTEINLPGCPTMWPMQRQPQ